MQPSTAIQNTIHKISELDSQLHHYRFISKLIRFLVVIIMLLICCWLLQGEALLHSPFDLFANSRGHSKAWLALAALKLSHWNGMPLQLMSCTNDWERGTLCNVIWSKIQTKGAVGSYKMGWPWQQNNQQWSFGFDSVFPEWKKIHPKLFWFFWGSCLSSPQRSLDDLVAVLELFSPPAQQS